MNRNDQQNDNDQSIKRYSDNDDLAPSGNRRINCGAGAGASLAGIIFIVAAVVASF